MDLKQLRERKINLHKGKLDPKSGKIKICSKHNCSKNQSATVEYCFSNSHDKQVGQCICLYTTQGLCNMDIQLKCEDSCCVEEKNVTAYFVEQQFSLLRNGNLYLSFYEDNACIYISQDHKGVSPKLFLYFSFFVKTSINLDCDKTLPMYTNHIHLYIHVHVPCKSNDGKDYKY